MDEFQMSFADIGNPLIILSAFVFSLIVPPLIVSLRICKDRSWPDILFLALVIGLSTQAVLGFLFNDFIRSGIGLEIAIYMLGWLAATVIICARQRKGPSYGSPAIAREDLLLLVILILAIAVRSIHPINHLALGQSDAYSHLQFLRDVIDRGFVQNVIYPPGYHWILALPTKIFHLDPYLVARYVGAFFGAGLVLAIYVLVKPLAGCSSALLSAFLMACFPGFYLLQKTGVGAFANQLGLFFIPTAFCFYIAKKEKALALSLMGLSVSVPMMLIHVLLTLAIAHLAFFIRERVDRWPRTGILALAVLPAILLLGLHFFQAGPVHQKATIVVITQGASTISAPSPSGKASEETDRVSSGNHPLMRLIRDFLSGKRLGFGNTGVNAIGCVLLILFVITIVGGIARGRPGLALLGFWGFIASLQTLTGVLQFSGYQREGWSLMIAVACLLGIIGGRVYDRGRGKRRVLFRTTAIVVAILSITGSFLYPPAHELRASCGEDELIRVVRNISSRYSEKSYLSITDKAVGAHPGSLLALSPRLPLTIITRKMTGWPGSNQGELVPTVIDPSDKLRVRTVPPGADLSAYLPQNGQHVVLLDKLSEDCLRNNVFFSFIDPRQVQNYLNDRQSYYKINDTILSYIDALDPNAWNIEENMFGNNLSVFTIVPTGRNP